MTLDALIPLIGAIVGGFAGGWAGGSHKIKNLVRAEVHAALDAHESSCRLILAKLASRGTTPR